MRPRGARSRSAVVLERAADDYVDRPARRVSIGVSNADGDASSDDLRATRFECHALATSRGVVACAGCAPSAPGDGVVYFAPRGRGRGVWRRARGARGCASAAATRDDADEFAVGMTDGSVWVYRCARSNGMEASKVATLTPPGWDAGWGRARDASATRCARLVVVGRARRAGTLVARHGSGGASLAVWDVETLSPSTASGEAKGFASMAKSTWLGTTSAYAALGGDGFVATSMDQKSVAAVEVNDLGRARLIWRSRREPGRGVFLAGAAVIDRGGTLSSRAATCSCEEMVHGTTYAAPDSSVKLVILDAEDGAEVNRFSIEGLGASNVFIDCGSLCSVGGSLFLAHRDGAIWVINPGNGALITSLHPAQHFHDTSGHRRTLPSLLAITPARDEMYGATCDGGVAHCWRVGNPTRWSRASHKNFPAAFRESVRTLLLCVHAHVNPTRAMMRVKLAPRNVADDDDVDVDGHERLRHVEGFIDAAAREPALLEMIVGRMARALFGCEVDDAF